MAAKEKKAEATATATAPKKTTAASLGQEGRGDGDHGRDDRRARVPHLAVGRGRQRRGELAPGRSRAARRVVEPPQPSRTTRTGGSGRARARRVVAVVPTPTTRTRPGPRARVGHRTVSATAGLSGRGEGRDRPAARGREPGLPAPGAADAGAVVRGAHPARLLRDRVPGARAVRRVALPAHRRPALPDARQALVEGDDRAVRRRRRHRHDPQLRVRPALARLHGDVRERLRPRLRARGLLVLPRGDLHRDLRLRRGTGSRRARTSLCGVADRDHRHHRAR